MINCTTYGKIFGMKINDNTLKKMMAFDKEAKNAKKKIIL